MKEFIDDYNKPFEEQIINISEKSPKEIAQLIIDHRPTNYDDIGFFRSVDRKRERNEVRLNILTAEKSVPKTQQEKAQEVLRAKILANKPISKYSKKKKVTPNHM